VTTRYDEILSYLVTLFYQITHIKERFMKKLLTTLSILGLMLMMAPDSLQAQRGSDSSSGFEKAVKIGPFGFLFGSYNATFEKMLNEKSSFVVGGRFSSYSLSSNDYTAIGLNGQYRLYFKEAIAGPYLAPSASLGFNSGTVGTVDETFTNIGIGANIGWQWVADGGFVVDLGIGARYRNGFGDGVDGDFSGVLPSFQIQIGYAF